MEYHELSLAGVITASARGRTNLVRIDNLLTPGDAFDRFFQPGIEELAERMINARRKERPVIWSLGAHVIKSGLSRYLIELIKAGMITHLSGNGACSIHDFELAFLGGTSEDVPTAIEDGSFGMWEETGSWMNEAIFAGAHEGWGYGEALARYADMRRERFPHLEDCVFYQAWLHGIPATYHIALGTDIIHQHPTTDFGAIGKTSQVDFLRYWYIGSQVDEGVFLNFGSSVLGPEVCLKALSISTNLGYDTFKITTANFDLRKMDDIHRRRGYDDPDYYYRPLKNIVDRPVSRGGAGWHFTGNHVNTIPTLYALLKEKGWSLK